MPGTPFNIFFTEHLFGEAIEKSKELMLTEMNHLLMRTGVLQTRDFIPPELYLEYIESCIRLVWFGMYREDLINLGLTDMTPGKYNALKNELSIPTRFIDLIEGIISPVLIGKDIFVPAELLVRCKYHTVEHASSIVWGIPVDDVVGLPRRYGFSMRNSIVDRIKQFPGAMSFVPDYADVHISNRVIRFLNPVDDNFAPLLHDEPAEPIHAALPQGDPSFIIVDDEVDCSEESLRGSELVERYSELCTNIYEADENDYSGMNWFTPFVYASLQEGDFGRALAAYLHLVWVTNADINSRNHGATFGHNQVQLPGSYFPFRGNDRRHPRSYSGLSTLSDIRRKEGRLTPPDTDEINNRNTLIASIEQAWYRSEFPSIEDANKFVQITWDLTYTHPFMLVKSLTRSTKVGKKVGKNTRKTKIQGNIHGATTSGQIDKPAGEA